MFNKWTTRNRTQDAHIIEEIYRQNCYRMPEDLTGHAVIDIGANVGAFTILCLDRGADKVIAAELDPENFAILKEHVARHEQGDRCTVYNRAIVGHDAYQLRNKTIRIPQGFHQWRGCTMTGGKGIFGEVAPDQDFHLVKTMCVCTLLKEAGDKPTIMKLDCEGAEHQILYRMPGARNVVRIVGESHTITDVTIGPAEQNMECLAVSLTEAGMQDIRVEDYPDDDRLHLFFASRGGDL